MSGESLRFKNDAPARKRLFAPGAMAHPAKGHIALWQEMVERYTHPGDWVLDPMAGIGTSLVAALMGRNVICVELEPHFVGPMKASWAKMQQHPMLGYTMGQAVILRGDARALPLCSADVVLTSPPYEGTLDHDPGNKRHLVGISAARTNPHSYTRPAAIVTSPPYEGVANASKNTNTNDGLRGHPETENRPLAYGQGENIGNQRGGDLYALLVYNRLRREPNQPVEVHLCGRCLPAEIAAFLLAGEKLGVLDVGANQWPKKPESESTTELSTSALTVEQELTAGLHDAGLVPQLPLVAETTMNGRVDSQRGGGWLGISSDGQCLSETTTSVPTADRKAWLSTISKVQNKLGENGITALEIWLQSAWVVTTESTQLLGCILCNASPVVSLSNQETQTLSVVLRLRFVTPSIAPLSVLAGGQKGNYWLSMLLVYEECFRVLKPQGILALVLKGFTRDGQYVDLPGQTEALLLAAGWEKHDEWRRELWSLSFWRTLQKRRDPAAFDERLNYEEVLAFRKPEGAGDGMAAVLTSPPVTPRR